MPTRIQIRRGTAAQWTSSNPTLSLGEVGFETDTRKIKVGDGTTAWTSLSYSTEPIPSQTSNSGKYLTTNGTSTSWATVDALPSQTGNSGRYLTTNGTTASWGVLDLSAKANLASPTFTGTPAAPTAAADTNTTQIATTAFVVGQAGSATPLVNGTAAVGTSLRYARQDHVHGTDTTRAPLASPTFTGTVTIPTLSLTTADTATTASHYFVETASDGVVRPKTLASVRTEIVTTAAVNAAAATTVGTVTSGTWSATNIALNRGGTNASLTAVNGGVVYSTGSAMAITAAGTAGQVLTSNGASAPTWSAAPESGFNSFLLSGM